MTATETKVDTQSDDKLIPNDKYGEDKSMPYVENLDKFVVSFKYFLKLQNLHTADIFMT